MLRSQPLQISYFDEPRLVSCLRDLDRQEGPFEASVCHLIRAVPLTRAVRAKVRAISLCDALSLGLERRLSHAPVLERPSIWLEAGKVRHYEATVLEHFDEGWVVSDVDRSAFGAAAAEKIRVLPNGVDERLLRGDIPRETPPFVGFVGHLGVPHNVDAAVMLARRILPLLRARGLSARVRLIGPEPGPAVRALAALEGVELSGYASDLKQALHGFRVMCAPLRFSAGVQNKVLEAVAAGVPSVTSPAAVAALGPEAPAWIRSAATPEEYAQSIAASWERTPATIAHAEEGRRWIASRFRWAAYADRLQELIER
jgi:glycosyltransferase involved in cell wall biosynthesis